MSPDDAGAAGMSPTPAGEPEEQEDVEDTRRKSVLLRLDPAVHRALAQWASDDLRSLNAHIELLLRDALRKAGRGVTARPMRGPGRPPKQG